MRWTEIRAAHPDQWLVVEALEAHSANDHRVFDRVGIVEVFRGASVVGDPGAACNGAASTIIRKPGHRNRRR